MRIGILTHPLIANYGGIIQNYALQQILIKMGHTPITIRLKTLSSRRKDFWIKDFVFFILKRLLGRKCTFPIPTFLFEYRRQGMEKFIVNNINVTSSIKWYSSSLVSDYKLDALCVGSDKIWASYFLQIEDLFFDFAKDYDIFKFSYAPSFGSDVWKFSIEKTRILANLVKQFSGLSVREKSGIQLCREYLGREAKWVLDPTLLLSAEEYNVCCKHILPKSTRFVLAYVLNMSPEKENFIYDVAEKLDLDVRIVKAEKYIKKSDSVDKWLSLYRDASYVITDSFHGTLFSLIYNKDFVSIINPNRGADRFNSLREQFSIADRIVYRIPNTEDILKLNIDWELINHEIDIKREESISYIRESLTIRK